MKTRVITTRKILVATVVVGAAGCSRPGADVTPATAEAVRSVAPPARTEAAVVEVPTPPPAQPDPRPLAEVPEQSQATAADVPADQARVSLRRELESVPIDQAVARLSHFRPLCDDKGFPLVGNVIRKAPIETQPSQLCDVVRARFVR